MLGVGGQIGRALVSDVNFTHLRYESRLIADEITQQVDHRLESLQRLAAMLEDNRHTNLREELRHNDALLEWFDGLVVADAEGVVLADWPVVEGRSRLSTADSEFFRFVRAVRRPYVSEPFVGRASDDPLVLFTVPRLRDGEFDGFVGGYVDLHSGGLFERLRRLRLGDGGGATVITASGIILYHHDQDRVLQEVPSLEANPVLHRALDGWQGETVGPLIDGREAYQAFRQIWPADWVVEVALPEAQVLEPMQRLFRWLWWVGVSFVLLNEDALRRWEAEHDPLTGLLNRRGFERRLEEALAEWHKTGTPSALMLLDLDHFKPVNDEGGHALGDEMLRCIARVLLREVRRSDYVARQGGDEFALLLPSCTLGQAERLAEAVRKGVREVSVVSEGREYRVSLSVGVTAFRKVDREIARVIERADAASYRAKAAGRDRVVMDTE